jgi:hypothetical protein
MTLASLLGIGSKPDALNRRKKLTACGMRVQSSRKSLTLGLTANNLLTVTVDADMYSTNTEE